MEDEDCMIWTMELAYTNTDSMERQGGHTHLFQLCDCSWVGGPTVFHIKLKYSGGSNRPAVCLNISQ